MSDIAFLSDAAIHAGFLPRRPRGVDHRVIEALLDRGP